SNTPAAIAEMLLGLDFYLDTARQIVIVTPKSRSEAEPFLAEMRKVFNPNAVLAVASEGENLAQTKSLIPIVEDKVASHGKATAYVCEHNVCQLPTSDPKAFAEHLAKVEPLP